jgi:glycosyltransferase involved in cell wall biosynthesis
MLVSKELGGAGLIALQLAADFRERVRQSCVWIPGEGPAATKARELGFLHLPYDPTRAFRSGKLPGVLCNLNIARLLRRYQPGLIHVHSPSYYGALSLGLKFSGLKTVVHVHLEEEKEGLRWALKRCPDAIITCAKFLAEHVRSVLPRQTENSQRIVAIPNAVDTERFHPGDKLAAKIRVGVPSNVPLVLMVANIAEHKGHTTALRAVAILKRKGIPAQFWFAGIEREGGDEYTCRLQRIVQELAVTDQVRFLGQRNDIPDLLRAADFFVLPSRAEGLPVSILEAQASGVPVLAAPTAGIPELIVNAKTGYLIRADDAKGYAARIHEMLRTPRLYMEISERARARIMTEHSWKTYLEHVWDVYEKLTH